MSNTTTTVYMSLVLPIPGFELGPQYAQENNTAFTTIDQHTHVPGQGLPVPTAGLNINADLPINNYNITSQRSSKFTSQATPLALVTDINCLSVVNGELFYNDLNGTAVQITLNGAVDTSFSGTIVGMGATTASAVYTSFNNTFSFYSNTNTPANLLIGPISISRNTTSTPTITITPSILQVSNYSITLPPALPTESAFLTYDSAGTSTVVYTDSVTTAFVNTGGTAKLVALFPTAMMIPYAANFIPTGWLLCDGSAVSRTTYAVLFSIIGTTWGIGNGSTTFNIPDCRGLFLRGVDGSAGRDPNSSSRTAINTGGNTGNNIGSYQADDFASHTHTQAPHTHTSNYSNPDVSGGNTLTGWTPTGGTVGTFTTNTTTATNNNTGGSETRPINVYINYLIKT